METGIDWVALGCVFLIAFALGAFTALFLVKVLTERVLRRAEAENSRRAQAFTDDLAYWGGADNGEDWGETEDDGERGLLP